MSIFPKQDIVPKCWALKEKIKGTYLEEIWSFPFFLSSMISMEYFPLENIFLSCTYSNSAFFPTLRLSLYFILGKYLTNKNYFDVNETRSSGLFLAEVEQKPEERVLALSW